MATIYDMSVAEWGDSEGEPLLSLEGEWIADLAMPADRWDWNFEAVEEAVAEALECDVDAVTATPTGGNIHGDASTRNIFVTSPEWRVSVKDADELGPPRRVLRATVQRPDAWGAMRRVEVAWMPLDVTEEADPARLNMAEPVRLVAFGEPSDPPVRLADDHCGGSQLESQVFQHGGFVCEFDQVHRPGELRIRGTYCVLSDSANDHTLTDWQGRQLRLVWASGPVGVQVDPVGDEYLESDELDVDDVEPGEWIDGYVRGDRLFVTTNDDGVGLHPDDTAFGQWVDAETGTPAVILAGRPRDREAFLGAALETIRARSGEEGLKDLGRVLESLAGYFGTGLTADEDAAAANAAVELAAGEITLEALSYELHQARRAERDSMARLVGAIRWAYEHDAVTETELVRTTGLSRVTVRKAMGL